MLIRLKIQARFQEVLMLMIPANNKNPACTLSSQSSVYSVQGVSTNKQNQSLVQCTFNTTANLTVNSATTLTISTTMTPYITIMTGNMNGKLHV